MYSYDMREDPKQETQSMEEETRRSKTVSAHKQIESKAAEIMQEGDNRPMGKQSSPETFIDFSPPPLST